MSGFDYSKWDNIELSDDESDCHPNIDKVRPPHSPAPGPVSGPLYGVRAALLCWGGQWQ